MAKRRVGLWLIGAFGGVGSSVALGLAALQRQLINSTGLVSALGVFAKLNLDDPLSFVIGGHEIRNSSFAESARGVGGGLPAYPATIIDACKDELVAWSANVVVRSSPSTLNELQSDLRQFVVTKKLEQLVVVNVASTEPPTDSEPAYSSLTTFQEAVAAGHFAKLPASVQYAFSAIDAGFPFVNFTPSPGVVPALVELAQVKKLPIAGSDGKTGETLLKSVLAPMFAARNLKPLSWVGHNILGNSDGKTLADPAIRKSKLKSKDQALAAILGERVPSHTTIEYVESLDDWKTAWDHVDFQGFLGVRMNLQFTWHGCDSALAAPLVIDLARFVLLAQRRGESGVLTHLAAFFKSPLGTDEHDFSNQMAKLTEYARLVSK